MRRAHRVWFSISPSVFRRLHHPARPPMMARSVALSPWPCDRRRRSPERKPHMLTSALRTSAMLIVVATLPVFGQTGASQLVTVRHGSGQGVAPVYEGFDINADGSYNM